MNNNPNVTTRAFRILIVDDHPLMREGIANLLRTQPDFQIGGEASSPNEAVDALRRDRPDIILLDLSLKESSGFNLLKQLVQIAPDVPALVLSMHDENYYAEVSLKTGARGYIMKTESPETLIGAIRDVLAGKTYLSAALRDRLIRASLPVEAGPSQKRGVLSDREREVFSMIGQGKTSREIATVLGLSHKTIEAHREHIKKKLNLANSPQLMRKAVEYVQALNTPL